MSIILPDDKELLQGVLHKIILYRVTRNINNELVSRKIKHYQLSEATGRSGNWFNRTFNNLEDMRVSTLIKLIAGVTKIVNVQNKDNPISITSIIDDEIMEIASVLLDLNDVEIEDLLSPDSGMTDFFINLKFYVDSLETTDGISPEESDVYGRIISLTKRSDKNG
ncbi:hypothetical protein BABA_10511 [Neobacillus bataviensis LMG 21833]|uniref:Uncharacterized protein n=1 Tax=Neobacillus bataviensis LMG 21833 TaxID=1117379 RepID=K6DM88_9BACI|nr:hypothetical protein [Neobacillus bataviensis]EKN69288.1 hypothetical protein BABA_10511 [Neobacillus bataviensis LMG 21833]